jgi:hypothetical protein
MRPGLATPSSERYESAGVLRQPSGPRLVAPSRLAEREQGRKGGRRRKCQRAAPPPTVALQIDGPSQGGPTRCDQRSCQGGYFYVPVRRGVCPLRVQGMSRGPALPTWAWAGPGMTGLLGTGPRAMPLRAAPGQGSGPRRVQPETSATRHRCCSHPDAAWTQAVPGRGRPSSRSAGLNDGSYWSSGVDHKSSGGGGMASRSHQSGSGSTSGCR